MVIAVCWRGERMTIGVIPARGYGQASLETKKAECGRCGGS